MIDLVIITGVYGSGKSSALYTFEEAGYYVIDNVPLDVIKPLFDSISKNKKYEKVAVALPLEISANAYEISKNYKDFKVSYLGITCSKEVLMERFRLTRKRHPFESQGYTLEEAIQKDFYNLEKVRLSFTDFIDTSKIDNREFKKLIHSQIMGLTDNSFSVTFMSFGYKRSVPQDIETVFDVRLLPNPYWVPELRELTGLDKKVRDYVLDAPETKEYLSHVIEYLDYYLEELKKSDRGHANIGIACSGGQHRSVAIAQYLCDYFANKYTTSVSHRDLFKK